VGGPEETIELMESIQGVGDLQHELQGSVSGGLEPPE